MSNSLTPDWSWPEATVIDEFGRDSNILDLLYADVKVSCSRYQIRGIQAAFRLARAQAVNTPGGVGISRSPVDTSYLLQLS